MQHITTLRDFTAWIQGKTPSTTTTSSTTTTTGTPATTTTQLPDLENHWGYVSYKRAHELFVDHPEVVKNFDWSLLGLAGAGSDTNFWYGSKGCRTQCHYDSYGTNVVVQLHGHKSWLLFPPKDAEYLYPTRVPYEESSVYSRVNVRAPDLNSWPLLTNVHPHHVKLGPGDILFVPHHWWHDVKAESTSISVNLWMPYREDPASLEHEAMVGK